MDDSKRYTDAAHAMQSGVAMKMNYDPAETEPKHLRVGINAAHSDICGLATLLISKGIFTQEEYVKAIADAMEIESADYASGLSARLGTKVTLA